MIRRVVLFLALASSPLVAHAQGCQAINGVVYGTYVDNQGATRDLLLDLRIPTAAPGPTPVVVWVHGGGWSGGSRAMPARASALCERGYAVASIDYRLTGTAPWPAQGQDCKGALRWLRANAATYDLDPDRFGVWGSSAGGHLVAWLGAAGGVGTTTFGNTTMELEGTTGGNLEQSSRVQAVVDWYGPTDLQLKKMYPTSIEFEAANSPEGRLVGGPVAENPERVAMVNPISFLSPDDPPFLLMHGTVDSTVPFHQSEILYRALVNRGLSATFTPILDAGHGGGNFESPATLGEVYDFLDRHLLDLPDVRVSLHAAATTVAENGGVATFKVARTGSTVGELVVPLTTAGTAGAGQDFAAIPATVTIPVGESEVGFAVAVVNDGAVEGSETLSLVLRPSTSYRLAAEATVATVTIVDDETAVGRPLVTLVATDPVASESGPDSGTFRLTRTGSTASALTVNLRVSGSAVLGTDFSVLGTPTVIPAGQANLDLTVTPLADGQLEVTETVYLAIQPAGSYALGAPAVAGLRVDERDQLATTPMIGVVAIDFDASESGNPGAFLVTRTGSTTASLTASLQPGGTATNGGDFVTLPTSVSFGVGVNRITVTLTPSDDALMESAETATLRARTGTGYLIGPTSAPVTIVDDDSP
jgi:acetyl esterase/lipase